MAVLLDASVPPCEQIQQVFRAESLVEVSFLCLLLLASEVSLQLPMEWNSVGHFAVGELHESLEQAVMPITLPWQLQFDIGGFQLVGLPSLSFAFPFLVVARGQSGRCCYDRTLGDSSPLA